MTTTFDRSLAIALRKVAHPLTGGPDDLTPLLSGTGHGRFVLIGEASLGRHEFYRIRAEITRQLMRNKEFTAVPRQFDVLLHYDRTRAVEPLERTTVWSRGDLPETYPTAL